MFDTADDIFHAFLEAIRKQHTAVVTPPVFVNVWNLWAMPKWIGDNVSLKEGVELTEKQIEDMQPLRSTYGIILPGSIPSPIPQGHIYYNMETHIPLPDGILIYHDAEDKFLEDAGRATVLPRYMRTLNVMVKFDYHDTARGECGLTGLTEWCVTKYLRSDQEAVIRNSIYRKPIDHRRVYYTVGNNYLKIIRGIGELQNGQEAVTINSILFDYYRYPNLMTYDDQTGQFSYTIDLPGIQIAEVLGMAVQLYLERVTDPRYRSFLQEQMLQQPTKA